MMLENMHYNNGQDVTPEEIVMPKRITQHSKTDDGFGKRLARFRRAAGYSQRDLAAEVGISQRMVAYYEKENGNPPTHLLSVLCRVLGVSADQLLGLKKVKDNGKARDTRLWRRMSQVEKLPAAQRKQITQILDAFLEREKFKKGK